MVLLSLPSTLKPIEPYLPLLLAVSSVAVLAFLFRNAMDTDYSPSPAPKRKYPAANVLLFGDRKQTR